MSRRALLTALAATLGAVPGAPVRETRAEGILSRLRTQNIECLQRRAAAALNGPTTYCRDLSGQSRTFFEHFSRVFCESPAQFCAMVRATEPAALVAAREREFVTPTCEPGVMREEIMAEANAEAMGADGVRDPEYMRLLRASWGCDEGRIEVYNGTTVRVGTATAGVPRFRRVFDCSAAQAPWYGCRETEGVELDVSRRTLPYSPYLGAQRLEGGRCRITIAESGFESEGAPSLPEVAPGETYASYRARTTGLRAAVDARVAGLNERVQQQFALTAESLGSNREMFRTAARATLTEVRVLHAEILFEAAREGVIAYLESVGAPTAILANVRKSRIAGLRPFLSENPTEDEEAEMEAVEQSCWNRGEDPAFGHGNACNHPSEDPHDGDPIMICPSMLADLDLANPRALLGIFAHEIGHSFDPCQVTRFATSVRSPVDVDGCTEETRSPGGSAHPVSPSAETDAATLAFVDRVSGPSGVASCLHHPAGASSSSPVSPARPDLMRNLGAAMQSCQFFRRGLQAEAAALRPEAEAHEREARAYRRSGETGLAEYRDGLAAGVRTRIAEKNAGAERWRTTNLRCAFDQYAPGGLREHCNADLSGLLSADTGSSCAGARTIITQLSDRNQPTGRREQSGEAFADMIAAQALPLALRSSRIHPNLDGYPARDDKRAETLSAISPFCQFHGGPGDEHPDPDYRASVFGEHVTIREDLDCSPSTISAPSDAFPTAGCASRLPAPPAE